MIIIVGVEVREGVFGWVFLGEVYFLMRFFVRSFVRYFFFFFDIGV